MFPSTNNYGQQNVGQTMSTGIARDPWAAQTPSMGNNPFSGWNASKQSRHAGKIANYQLAQQRMGQQNQQFQQGIGMQNQQNQIALRGQDMALNQTKYRVDNQRFAPQFNFGYGGMPAPSNANPEQSGFNSPKANTPQASTMPGILSSYNNEYGGLS